MKRLVFAAALLICILGLAQAADSIFDAASKGDLAAVTKLIKARPGDVNVSDTYGKTPLMYAAQGGRLPVVEFLISKGADVNRKAQGGETALDLAVLGKHVKAANALIKARAAVTIHDAAGLGFAATVRKSIEKDPKLLSAQDVSGRTPLFWAAILGQKETVRLLLDAGADPNTYDRNRSYAIDVAHDRGYQEVVDMLLLATGSAKGIEDAVRIGSASAVRTLLDRNPKLISKNLKEGFSLLTVAMDRKGTDMVQMLLARGADPNARNWEGKPLLHVAVANNRLDLARLLLSYKADIDGRNPDGDTALYFAAMEGKKEFTQLLTSKGAKVGIREATALGDIDRVAKLLSADPKLVSTRTAIGQTPLFTAAAKGYTEIASVLIAQGADPRAMASIGANFEGRTWGMGYTPLHAAAWNGRKSVVSLLISRRVNVNAKIEGGLTPLHLAAGRGFTDVAALLISRGANANALGRDQMDDTVWPVVTPLHSATMGGSIATVKMLLSAGVNVNAKGEFDEDKDFTPLHMALSGNSENGSEIARILVSKGADVNAETSGGVTPLFWAVERMDRASVNLLLSKGANVNPKRCSPLITALRRSEGENEVSKLLIAKGANVNVRDSEGNTPLHIAVGWTDIKMVELLVSKGADVNARNNKGETPLAIADRFEDFGNIRKFLRDHGATGGLRAK